MRKTSVLLQCWCDVGRSSERRKSARLQVLLMNNFSALGSQFSHRPGHPTQQADYCANFGVRFSRVLAPSLASDLVPHAYCLHCPSLPRLEQPVRAQDRRFQGLKKCPGSSSTASARERHQPPTLARRQPASRAAPLGALGRRSAMREPPEAGRGGCRVGGSILTQVPWRQDPW